MRNSQICETPMLMRVQVQEGSFAARYIAEHPELDGVDPGLLDWGALFEHELRKETGPCGPVEKRTGRDGARFTNASKPARKPTPDGLLLPPQAADKLNVTIEQLMGFVRDGELRYVNLGRGSKRPRYAFTDTDINDLIEKRQTREAPCPSTGRQIRRSGNPTSGSKVIGFTARRNAQLREAETFEAIERESQGADEGDAAIRRRC